MGLVLLILGLILAAIGHVGILIEAFKEGIGWGLGTLLIPIVALIFVFMHWQETRKPFLLSVVGNVIWIVGSVMMNPN